MASNRAPKLEEFSGALKANFENKSLWLSFALSQESARGACQAFSECLRIDQFDPLPAMLAAKVTIQQLNDPIGGLHLANEAIERCLRLLSSGSSSSHSSKSLEENQNKLTTTNVTIEDHGDGSSKRSSLNLSKPTNNHLATSSSSPPSSSSASSTATRKANGSCQAYHNNNNNNNNNTIILSDDQNQSSYLAAKCRYKNLDPILSKCYLLASLMHAHIYEREPESIRQFKIENLKSSLHYLDLAFKTYPNDYLVHFHRALHEARQKSYSAAIDNVRKAIKLNPHHVPSIQLLILSLSALKLYNEALVLCESSLHEFEDNLLLLYIKCNLEQCLIETKGYKPALSTGQHILKCIRRVAGRPSSSSSSNMDSSPLNEAKLSQKRPQHHQPSQHSLQSQNPLQQHQPNQQQQQQHPASLQANHNTTNTTTTNTGTHTANNQNPTATTATTTTTTIVTPENAAGKQATNLFAENNNNIPPERVLGSDQLFSNGELSGWLLVAEIFIKLGSIHDAELCVDESSTHANGALSYQIMFVRGLIAKAKNNLIEAKSFFQSCLALQPKHAKALQQIAHVYHLLGSHSTAEKFLRDSLDIDSDCHKTWYYLSLVFIETNQHDKANECLKKVNLLEESSPVINISAISRLTLE